MKTTILIAIAITLLSGCTSSTTGEKYVFKTPTGAVSGTVSTADFSFIVPEGWGAYPPAPDASNNIIDYKRIGVRSLYFAGGKKMYPRMTICERDNSDGQSLQTIIDQTYSTMTPELRNRVDSETIVNVFSAIQVAYEQPWGEPWYRFEDVWIQSDQKVYLLSCWAPLTADDETMALCRAIVQSFTITP